MIVRVLTAQVPPGRVGHFNVAMRRQLAILRDQPGLVYVKLARRLEPGGGEEVLLFEEWRDPDSVYAWAGDDLSRPRLLPAALDAASEITVTHYEALDIGLEDGRAGAGAGLTGPGDLTGSGDLIGRGGLTGSGGVAGTDGDASRVTGPADGSPGGGGRRPDA